jgi:hypothetical protein
MVLRASFLFVTAAFVSGCAGLSFSPGSQTSEVVVVAKRKEFMTA